MSSRVTSSLGYSVFAEEVTWYEADGERLQIPIFINHDWPVWAELKVEEPSTTTGELVPDEVWHRVRQALRWLGWSVSVQRDGVTDELVESDRMRSEFQKGRWAPA